MLPGAIWAPVLSLDIAAYVHQRGLDTGEGEWDSRSFMAETLAPVRCVSSPKAHLHWLLIHTGQIARI